MNTHTHPLLPQVEDADALEASVFENDMFSPLVEQLRDANLLQQVQDAVASVGIGDDAISAIRSGLGMPPLGVVAVATPHTPHDGSAHRDFIDMDGIEASAMLLTLSEDRRRRRDAGAALLTLSTGRPRQRGVPMVAPRFGGANNTDGENSGGEGLPEPPSHLPRKGAAQRHRHHHLSAHFSGDDEKADEASEHEGGGAGNDDDSSVIIQQDDDMSVAEDDTSSNYPAGRDAAAAGAAVGGEEAETAGAVATSNSDAGSNNSSAGRVSAVDGGQEAEIAQGSIKRQKEIDD